MGSPLKRSFTAAVEDGYGLKYLKRRRVSGEFGFGEVGGQGQRERVRREGDVRARSVPEHMAVRNMFAAIARPVMLGYGHSG